MTGILRLGKNPTRRIICRYPTALSLICLNSRNELREVAFVEDLLRPGKREVGEGRLAEQARVHRALAV